jgi:hypothetical protein
MEPNLFYLILVTIAVGLIILLIAINYYDTDVSKESKLKSGFANFILCCCIWVLGFSFFQNTVNNGKEFETAKYDIRIIIKTTQYNNIVNSDTIFYVKLKPKK